MPGIKLEDYGDTKTVCISLTVGDLEKIKYIQRFETAVSRSELFRRIIHNTYQKTLLSNKGIAKAYRSIEP